MGLAIDYGMSSRAVKANSAGEKVFKGLHTGSISLTCQRVPSCIIEAELRSARECSHRGNAAVAVSELLFPSLSN